MAFTAPAVMKAWQYSAASGGIEANMKLNSKATPPPAKLSPEQVYIEVMSMSLNPVDYKLPEVPFIGGLVISKPASPGLDYCGKVLSAGSRVDVKPGQFVFGRLEKPSQFGTLAECIVTNRDGAVPLPEGVDPDSAAAIGTAGLTAYQCIVPFAKAGDKIFINGVLVVQAHSLCKDLGADEVIDYKTSDLTKALGAKGQIFSLAVDNVGTPHGLYPASHHYLKEGGRFVQVGAPVSLSAMYTLLSRMLLPGFLGGGKRPFQFLNTASKYDDFAQIGQWTKEGKVRAVIDTSFEFKDGPKAYEKLRTGRAKGKIVVHVTDKP
ncbi:tRNA wybutosine-synthesizing protein [Physcia stellaris]|nr:tRNA wybutosine-synthesizing protein [Physcia stellaris]